MAGTVATPGNLAAPIIAFYYGLTGFAGAPYHRLQARRWLSGLALCRRRERAFSRPRAEVFHAPEASR